MAGTTSARQRIVRSHAAERPGWNEVEVICQGDRCRHVVNGQTVLEVERMVEVTPNGRTVPLRNGHIQIQSAGAEIFFRDISIRRL